jgi:hypothetical protein
MATGALADVNALLAGVTFNPATNFNGSFSIATSVSDGVAPAVTGTKMFTGTAMNDAPSGSVTVTGQGSLGVVLGQVGEALTVSNDLNDADGMGTLSYVWTRSDGLQVASGSSYTLREEDAGHTVSAAAVYTDGGGTSETKEITQSMEGKGTTLFTAVEEATSSLAVKTSITSMAGLVTTPLPVMTAWTTFTGAVEMTI